MKPNVILINADDLGFGDLERYGNKLNKTPYLNEFAKSGITFTDNYAASSICSPSRAGLMTGCYPARVSVNRVLFPGEKYGLHQNEYTMAQMFKDSGYETILIGKWHLGDQEAFLPDKFGFDDFYGLPYSNDMGRQLKRDGTMTEFPPLPLMHGTQIIEEQPEQASITERYTEKAVEFIRENKEKNFFLYLAHMHVHLPLYSGERFIKESKNGDFGACVAEMDWSCGVIMNELKKLGLEENTIVVFTSDNGSKANFGASNYPLKGSKFESWEGGFRVPMMISWKNHIPENQECDEIVSHIDLMPTFAKLIGATLPEIEIDGQDISQTLFGNQTVRDNFIYFTARNRGEKLSLVTIDAVRCGDYKLFFNRLNRQTGENCSVKELYNVTTDLSEDVNVYDAHPNVVEAITKIYQEYETLLGNHVNGVLGAQVRPCGEVENPKPLTMYDENHPYIVSYYDKAERG